MKKLPLSALGIAAALAAGCVVTSVYPYYTAKDVVYDPALAGDWTRRVEGGGDELWKFVGDPADRSYRFVRVEEREARVYDAHLFKLGDRLFLDVASRDTDFRVVPPHYLLRVDALEPTPRLSDLRHDWLAARLDAEPEVLRHTFVPNGDGPGDRRVVLTADTAELQRFVLATLGTAEAWSDGFELTRPAAPPAPP